MFQKNKNRHYFVLVPTNPVFSSVLSPSLPDSADASVSRRRYDMPIGSPPIYSILYQNMTAEVKQTQQFPNKS